MNCHQLISVKWRTEADEVAFAECWLMRRQITTKDGSGKGMQMLAVYE